MRHDIEVIALRRSKKGSAKLKLASDPTWITKRLDQLNPSDFEGVDTIVHLAAHTANPPYDTLQNCLHWNLVAPLAMFEAAHSKGSTRFVVAGSCFEYGTSADRFEFIPADAPLEPLGTYPTSKACASLAFKSFAATTGARLSIHRIFQAFGEGEIESRLWPSLRRAATQGKDFEMKSCGTQVRDFIPAEHVAKALFSACFDETVVPAKARQFNVGSGVGTSVREFAEYWWKKWQAKGNILFPPFSLRDNGIRRLVAALDD